MKDSQLAAFAGSMELLKKIHEATQDVYWVIDKDGHFVYVSSSVYQQRGFTPEEVMARPALESICEEDRARAAETFSLGLEIINQGLTRLPAGRVRLRQPRKNGGQVWTEVISEFFFDEEREFKFVIGMSRNIDALVALEQQVNRLKDSF
ncbi:MAG: hypothetical protein CVV42_02270 [Candidatus Riflebacteria bacterium HGW-Riflebacteria-2]|jgi:PAS domain S-box-containing protein|nr:MAG: hypothetical protein CVV42_02270 [Candidatus Riflebacteria bacterium HGW-Riflebacteria-2]